MSEIIIKDRTFDIRHSIDDKNLIAYCKETRQGFIVPVCYPTEIEIISIPNIVKQREEEAIDLFIKMIEIGDLKLL